MNPTFEIKEFDGNYVKEACTTSEIMIADSGYLATKIHPIYGLKQFEITNLYATLKQYKKKHGHAPSIVAALLYCYVQVLTENKRLHALKSWNNKLFYFKDIDLFIPFEFFKNGKGTMSRKVVKAINKKTVFELEAIFEEIRSTTSVNIPMHEKIFVHLPMIIKKMGYSLIMAFPLLRKYLLGNAFFSSVFKKITKDNCSFGIPYTFHSSGMFAAELCFKHDGTIHIGITYVADHAIVNGINISNTLNRFRYFIDHFNLAD